MKAKPGSVAGIDYPRTYQEFERWFADDERLAGALLDRLTHHVHILEIIGDSYRLKSSLDKGKENQR